MAHLIYTTNYYYKKAHYRVNVTLSGRYLEKGYYMKYASLLFWALITNGAMASEVDDYINEGIKLHDAGIYDKAAQKYKKALEIEPNNSLALYELTFSYMVSQNNDECIKVAKKGLSIESNLKNKFIITLGSCYSQLGETKEAIDAFEKGLAIDPTDSHLHLNIAVTLSNLQKDKEAISHLKEAIKYSNGYASPFYLIAEIYRTTNYRIPAIYFYMQYVLLEPNTKRSQDAAKKIYFLLYQGVNKKGNGDMNIALDPASPKDEGDFMTLDLALSVAAVASVKEINKSVKTDAESYTAALTSFVKISKELDDKSLVSTFTWKYAANNMIALENKDDFNTYSYILASLAGVPGATEWLNDNQVKIEKMSETIKTLVATKL